MLFDRAHADIKIGSDDFLPLAFNPESPKDFNGAVGKRGQRSGNLAQMIPGDQGIVRGDLGRRNDACFNTRPEFLSLPTAHRCSPLVEQEVVGNAIKIGSRLRDRADRLAIELHVEVL